MKKNILKKLINKALKEEKQQLNEYYLACDCKDTSGWTVRTIKGCYGQSGESAASACARCCEDGKPADPEGGKTAQTPDVRVSDRPFRGKTRSKARTTHVPGIPDFGPGGVPTKPVNNQRRGEPTIKRGIREAEMTVGDDNTAFKIKVDVSNKQSETKLGVRIQLTPKGGMLEPDVRDKVEIAITKKLNNALEQFDMQVSKDTDVPNPEVLGFFIPLSQIKNMIVKSIKGGSTPSPTGGASTPPTPPKPATPPAKPATPPAKPDTTNEMIEDMISEAIISEMRVRDLKEISKVVLKEDFYAFINAGNNVLRTLEENGRSTSEAKKYLGYLVKHNIM